jgi:tRNA (guanine-N7-)-methyltransferase
MRRTQRLPLEDLAPYVWDERAVGLVPTALNWSVIFGNDHPVEIEVGSGKGLFILNAAQNCPSVNFFGIEIVRKYQLYTATRIAIRKLTNVRMACTDARFLMRDRVAPGSVQAIHVYYPDPWWKKRHHKRRVFTPEFVESCVEALRPGGWFHLATDVAEYFAVMKDLCGRRPELHERPTAAPTAAGHDMDYLTNFERKARRQGQPVFRALFEKSLPHVRFGVEPFSSSGPTPC